MGNKAPRRQKARQIPIEIDLSLQSETVMAGQPIVGQVMIRVGSVFVSPGGLDKAVVTFWGYENVRCFEQRSNNPKMAKNKKL